MFWKAKDVEEFFLAKKPSSSTEVRGLFIHDIDDDDDSVALFFCGWGDYTTVSGWKSPMQLPLSWKKNITNKQLGLYHTDNSRDSRVDLQISV